MSALRKSTIGPICAVVVAAGLGVGIAIASPALVSQPLQSQNGWRPAWGLDRIDQREAALNDTYNYSLTGAGVSVYVFDSGINAAHEEFEGRVEPGFSVINDGRGTDDCVGHGTHTASLIGGKTYGVAKQVRLIPVRVLNCSNSNSSSTPLFRAIDWIIEHHQVGVPAIVNMSVGMRRSIALNDGVRKLIADGLIVVGAAGNQAQDACGYSPASETSIISVGGTQPGDIRARQSNFGSCVDLFAPGWDVVAGWMGGTSVYRSTSGTSNAAPIVSGIAALMLQENPALTQAEVEERLKSTATSGALSNIGAGSPNLLAFSPYTTTEVPNLATVVSISTAAPIPTVAPTTSVSTSTSTTTSTVVALPTVVPTTIAPPANLSCTRPSARTSIGGVPYVCVNTGNQLMWIPKRYSPSRG